MNTTFGHMAPQQGNARITAMLSTMELTSGITASLLPMNSRFSFLAANVFNHEQFLKTFSISRKESPDPPQGAVPLNPAWACRPQIPCYIGSDASIHNVFILHNNYAYS